MSKQHSNENQPFDPNAFENAQAGDAQAEYDAKVKQHLLAVVHPSWENSQGDSYEVQQIDVVMSQLKAQVSVLARILAPDIYEEYGKRKYAGVPDGEKPKLAQRREAYKYLMGAMIDRFYNIPGC